MRFMVGPARMAWRRTFASSSPRRRCLPDAANYGTEDKGSSKRWH